MKNSRYYNYTLNIDGTLYRHGKDPRTDYLTDVVTNETIALIKRAGIRPFFMVVSYPAPHGPEDPSPKYAELFADEKSHCLCELEQK